MLEATEQPDGVAEGPPTLVCGVGLDALFLVKQSQKTPSLDLLTKGPGFFGLSLFLLNLRIRSVKKINKGHPHTHTPWKQITSRNVISKTNILHST